jgi:hypothetical protein
MAQRRQIHHRFSRSISTELLIGPTEVADLLPAHKQELDLKDASMFILAYSIFVLARQRAGDQGRDSSGCRCYGCTGRYPGLLARTAGTESPPHVFVRRLAAVVRRRTH